MTKEAQAVKEAVLDFEEARERLRVANEAWTEALAREARRRAQAPVE